MPREDAKARREEGNSFVSWRLRVRPSATLDPRDVARQQSLVHLISHIHKLASRGVDVGYRTTHRSRFVYDDGTLSTVRFSEMSHEQEEDLEREAA